MASEPVLDRLAKWWDSGSESKNKKSENVNRVATTATVATTHSSTDSDFIKYAGDWKPFEVYSQNTLVHFQNRMFLSIINRNTNSNPEIFPAKWKPLSLKVVDGLPGKDGKDGEDGLIIDRQESILINYNCNFQHVFSISVMESDKEFMSKFVQVLISITLIENHIQPETTNDPASIAPQSNKRKGKKLGANQKSLNFQRSQLQIAMFIDVENNKTQISVENESDTTTSMIVSNLNEFTQITTLLNETSTLSIRKVPDQSEYELCWKRDSISENTDAYNAKSSAQYVAMIVETVPRVIYSEDQIQC